MKDRKIIWKMADGEVIVTTPAPKGRREGEPELDWIERVALKCKPDGATRMPDMEAKDLPSREFRHKWRHDGKKIIIDNTVADLPVVLSVEERLTALESK
ncbi:hypothetical protein LCGC14_0956320 [marine sediment metagenome]|uniref:Uncharacterized protein n=1 Tax=marine sediment metagenome TaxID=412755 RepID=A0A0F9QZ39_9ZZZZ